MTGFLKKPIITLSNFVGADKVLRKFNRRPKILFWHGVATANSDAVTPENISNSLFVRELDYLAAHYEVISLDEYYIRRISGNWSGHEVILTFDDGYRNNLTIAMPLLQERKLPFTVFVSTGHLDSGEYFPTSLVRMICLAGSLKKVRVPALGFDAELGDHSKRYLAASELGTRLKKIPLAVVDTVIAEMKSQLSDAEMSDLYGKYACLSPMTWSEVAEIVKYGGLIASHCVSHCCCHAEQDTAVWQQQLSLSKETIEKRLGLPCHYFAYPNGDFTSSTNEFLRECGYRLGFSTSKTKKLDICDFALPRINANIEFSKFRLLINL